MQVGYTPGVLTAATADMTVTLLLATSRRLLEGGASENILNIGWSLSYIHEIGDIFAVQAMLLSKLANGLLGALSGCVGETILENGMSRLCQKKTLQHLDGGVAGPR